MTTAHGSALTSCKRGLPGIFSAAIALAGMMESMSSGLCSVVLNQTFGSGAIDEPHHLAGEGMDELRRVSLRIARALQHVGQHPRFCRSRHQEHDEMGCIDDGRRHRDT